MNDDDSTSEEGVDAFTRVSMRRAVRSGVGRVVGSSQGAYYRPTDDGDSQNFWLPITNSNREMTFCRTMVEFWLTNLEKQKLPTGLPAGPRSLPPHFGPFYPQVDRFFAIKFLWTNGGQRSTWDELYFSRTFQEFGQTDCA